MTNSLKKQHSILNTWKKSAAVTKWLMLYSLPWMPLDNLSAGLGIVRLIQRSNQRWSNSANRWDNRGSLGIWNKMEVFLPNFIYPTYLLRIPWVLQGGSGISSASTRALWSVLDAGVPQLPRGSFVRAVSYGLLDPRLPEISSGLRASWKEYMPRFPRLHRRVCPSGTSNLLARIQQLW